MTTICNTYTAIQKNRFTLIYFKSNIYCNINKMVIH